MKKPFVNKLKSWGVSLVIFLVLLELSPFLLHPVMFGGGYSRAQVKAELWQQDMEPALIEESEGVESKVGETEQTEEEYLSDAILHPYIGYTSVPHPEYNRFAFPGADPLLKRGPNSYNVCLMGGSVTMGLHGSSKQILIEELKKDPGLKDKEIEVALFALGGFKQPQQLMALNYFLSQGAEYDLVINLDGFNEVVLPYSDNLPFNIYPSYPRHWHIFSRKKLDTRVQLILAEQVRLKKERRKAREAARSSLLSFSNFRLILWKIQDVKKASAMAAYEGQLRTAMQESESGYQATGPDYKVTDTTAFFYEQAEVWMRCSRQIAGMAKGMGFKYLHFLQPNQYVEGSKTFSDLERKIAIEDSSYSYKVGAIRGYPPLIESGKRLQQEGMNFHDLTMMFKDENKIVYSDNCCHFNEYGYAQIAKRIAREALAADN